MVKVAMMQPTFIPWQGFFELISKSDKFIFLDDFQLSVQSYQQRNRLFINEGKIDWYTVPLEKKKSFLQPLNQVTIKENGWREKMWRRIEANYKKASYFSIIKEELKKLIVFQHENLAIQNIRIIKYICQLLNYKKEFICSSRYNLISKRSFKVLDLLRISNATKYYSAQGSFGYMQEDGVFPCKDIEIFFQDFQCRSYFQVKSKNEEFFPKLSIIDAILNIGPEETRKLVDKGTSHWLSWEEKMSMSKLI